MCLHIINSLISTANMAQDSDLKVSIFSEKGVSTLEDLFGNNYNFEKFCTMDWEN